MRQVIDINGISEKLTALQKDQLRKFHQSLLKWNSKINLISKPTVEESEVLHVCDGAMGSLLILENSKASRFFDLGSGNGIPGVTFAILATDRKITCIDSDERKMSFIRYVKMELGLSNLEIICDRVEKLNFQEGSDFMARGFTSIDAACGLLNQKISPGNCFYHFKAEGWQKQLGENCSTWNISELDAYKLVVKSKESPIRHVVTTKKA